MGYANIQLVTFNTQEKAENVFLLLENERKVGERLRASFQVK